MTARRILPALLIAALAVACSDSATPATGPRTTTNSAMAASAPLLGAKADGAALGPGCESVVGTFQGAYDFSAGGWVGTLYLSIAGGTVETPTFLDAGNGDTPHGPRGAFSGTETNTITFSEGNTFQIEAKYNAPLAGTPGLYVLHETGKIINGTGAFADVSGNVSVDGPFTLPDDLNFQWIAAMHGSICGLQ